MDTNTETAVRRGPGRPPKNPDASAPMLDKDMEPVAQKLVEVMILRPYRPASAETLLDMGRDAEGVAAKIGKGETVMLPKDEANRALKAGIATTTPRTFD